MQQSPQVVFAAEDVAAAELQPFRHAGGTQTSTEFKWVVWKEPAHITLVYAWGIALKGKSSKQRKRKAASGLGALLAALRHHHGPDDTAQLEVEADYQEWRRVDSGSGTAEERLTAIKYLEKRLGVASGGSWQGALEVVSLPDMRHTCSPPPALVRLLSSTCSPPPALPCLLSSTCSPPPALPCLLSSACSPPPALLRLCLLSFACSPQPVFRSRCPGFASAWQSTSRLRRQRLHERGGSLWQERVCQKVRPKSERSEQPMMGSG